MLKRIIIVLLLLVSAVVCSLGIAACENGKTAYEMYKEQYIQINGSEDGVLSEADWLLSLKGKDGEDGEDGEDGKSAYELYVEAYVKATGSEEGVLSESEWLDYLSGKNGADGVGIDSVEIICGNIIIYYNNDTTQTLENALPEAGHNWNEGVITTNPTCITPGVITYTCNDCGTTKKELLEANGEHIWGEYFHDNDYHWRTCKICGEEEIHEHSFGDVSIDSDVNDIIECECGIHKTVGEFYSYKVSFECNDGVSVLIYETQDYGSDGVPSNVAYARDSSTGALQNSGSGQVNFEVVLKLGYKLKSITVTPESGYNNLKGSEDTGSETIYRITKITKELTVCVEAEVDILDLPVMVINTKNSAPILDQENYVTCNVSVLGADAYNFENASAGIRGRGNTTWFMPKKPYKLKFDSKIDLFGNGSAMKWVLIANYADPSLMRNFLAYSIAGEDGILNNTKYTTTVQNIELYLNGEYCGVYLVCEQNEAGSTRVDIDENLLNEDGSVKVNTGYLLESDSAYAPNEGTEGVDYFKVNGECYAIVSPDVEDEIFISHREEYIAFIQNIMQTIVDNLNNLTDTPENFDVLCDLMDIPSFVDGYLIDELTNTADGSYSSFYIFYDSVDGKLHRGPIWDYDSSCGNAAYVDERGDNNPEFLRASLVFWYNRLLNFDGFKQLVRERLSEISENDNFIKFLDNKVSEVLACSESFNRNFEKWDGVLGQNNLSYWNTEIIISLTTWREQVDYLSDWLKASYNNLLKVYC